MNFTIEVYKKFPNLKSAFIFGFLSFLEVRFVTSKLSESNRTYWFWNWFAKVSSSQNISFPNENSTSFFSSLTIIICFERLQLFIKIKVRPGRRSVLRTEVCSEDLENPDSRSRLVPESTAEKIVLFWIFCNYNPTHQ